MNVTTLGGPPAEPGYDHAWFDWQPLPLRAPIHWPRGALLAVSVVLDLGATEWDFNGRSPVPPPGGRGFAPPPDIPRMAHREFGHRVGVFRLLEALGELNIRPAAAVDVLTAEHYRPLIDRLLPAVDEVLCHGLSASRPITSLMSADEEADYVGVATDRLTASLGTRPAGWLGPEHSESHRTPSVLSAAGYKYVADWGNDDLPYRMMGAASDLWVFPLSWELADLNTTFIRNVSPTTYADSIELAAETLLREGGSSGRVLALHLYPWLCGQAFRTKPLANALAAIANMPGVWFATPGEVVATLTTSHD